MIALQRYVFFATFAPMTTLYLVRHGETFDNERQIMQGQVQGELNPKGVEQARQLSRQLADKPIDVFVASDLKRAIDTCSIIAEPHGGQVITTPLLRERDWGSFTGRYIPDLEHAVWPDDVEPLETLKARAGKFLDFLRVNYPDKRILAVGHGIVNKAIQSVLYSKPMNQVQRMVNAEVRIMEIG